MPLFQQLATVVSAQYDEPEVEELAESTRAKHVMDCMKPETFFKKTDFDGSDIVKGIKGVKSASACCMKCSKHKKCEYWTYGTKGKRKNTCWVKTNMKGQDDQHNREAGYYDPCQDTSNVEDKVDYQGSDLVKGGFTGISTPKGCCQKCVATSGCKYWTLGKDRAVCWVKSGYEGWEEQDNRASGTFVVKKDGSLTHPDNSKKGEKVKCWKRFKHLKTSWPWQRQNLAIKSLS